MFLFLSVLIGIVWKALDWILFELILIALIFKYPLFYIVGNRKISDWWSFRKEIRLIWIGFLFVGSCIVKFGIGAVWCSIHLLLSPFQISTSLGTLFLTIFIFSSWLHRHSYHIFFSQMWHYVVEVIRVWIFGNVSLGLGCYTAIWRVLVIALRFLLLIFSWRILLLFLFFWVVQLGLAHVVWFVLALIPSINFF